MASASGAATVLEHSGGFRHEANTGDTNSGVMTTAGISPSSISLSTEPGAERQLHQLMDEVEALSDQLAPGTLRMAAERLAALAALRERKLSPWAAAGSIWECVQQLKSDSEAKVKQAVGVLRDTAGNCLGMEEIHHLREQLAAQRLRSETYALNAEVACHHLRRIQTLAANNLYEVRLRLTVRLCFQALKQGAPNVVMPKRWSSISAAEIAMSRRLLPGEALYDLAAISSSRSRTQRSPSKCVTKRLADTYAQTPRADANGSGPSERSRPRPTSCTAVTAPTTTSAASSGAIALAEAEELHDATLSHLLGREATRRGCLLTLVDGVRRRHLLRICLVALRLYSAVRCQGPSMPQSSSSD